MLNKSLSRRKLLAAVTTLVLCSRLDVPIIVNKLDVYERVLYTPDRHDLIGFTLVLEICLLEAAYQ